MPAEAEPRPVAAEPKAVAAEAPKAVAARAQGGGGRAQAVRRPRPKTTFLILYRPGPAWVTRKPITEQAPKEHGRYLARSVREGYDESSPVR